MFIYKIESKIPSDLKEDTESLIKAIKDNLDVENDPDVESNSKPENLIIETIKQIDDKYNEENTNNNKNENFFRKYKIYNIVFCKILHSDMDNETKSIYLYKFVQALYSANISQDIKEALFPKNLKQANQNKTFSYIDSYYQITEDSDCGSLSNEKLLKKLEDHINTETNDYNVLKKYFSDEIFNIKMFNFITNQEIPQKNIKSIIDKSKNSKEFTFLVGFILAKHNNG